ncbi:thioredoxin family protein [Chitinispirillum alkaliphilum]|nr:thioredoxin family protein [Chitinispirillum alkaliphilum]
MDAWLESEREHAVIVAFFATWCAPCWLELPFLQSVTDSLYDEGLRIVYISVDNSYGDEQREMVETLKLTGPVIHDRLGIVARRYEFTRALPYTVYINRLGQVSYISQGYTPEMNAALLEKIDHILNP